MTTAIQYGHSRVSHVSLGNVTLLAAARGEHPPLADVTGSVRGALAKPQAYPPLAAATVPGDHVAVSIDDGVPQVREVILGAVGALVDAGVEAELITVVSIAPLEDQDRLAEELAGMGAAGVRFEVHDPDHADAVAMVGVTSKGEPLRVNRSMAEADLLLPIAVARLPVSDGASAKFDGLFPQFSNSETRARFVEAAAKSSARQRARIAAEIDEAGWLLGIGMTVSVVPSAGGGVAAVIAGEAGVAAETARRHCREIWERTAQVSGDLVIAALSGEEREQTWENLASALQAAERVLLEGGAIAVCSELAEPPSGTLNLLLEAVDFEEVQHVLAGEGAARTDPAMVLARALERGPVYLRSRLPADTVESLGMTPIENDSELSRLAAGREHCIVIEEAQRVAPRLIGDRHAVE